MNTATGKKIAIYTGGGLIVLFLLSKLNAGGKSLSDTLFGGIGNTLGSSVNTLIAGSGTIIGKTLGGIASGAGNMFVNTGAELGGAVGNFALGGDRGTRIAQSGVSAIHQYGYFPSVIATERTLLNPMAWGNPKRGEAYKLVAPAEIINAQYISTPAYRASHPTMATIQDLQKQGLTATQVHAIMYKRAGLPYDPAAIPAGY